MTGVDPEEFRRLSEQALVKTFTMVEIWRERIHADAPSPEPGSSLDQDDRATDPYRLSQSAYLALISAVDHLETLRLVVQKAGVLPARGAFTLARAALENAAIAVWLLAPADRTERVCRSLRLEWADAVDEANALTQMGAEPALDERKRELQELARANGVSPDQVGQVTGRKVSYSSIVKKAGDEARELTSDRAMWAWTICSGLAHARRWAVLGFLRRDESPGETDDVSPVKLSATIEGVATMANVAAVMLAEGWRLFDERRQADRGC